jgi:hypothetical protein
MLATLLAGITFPRSDASQWFEILADLAMPIDSTTVAGAAPE